MPKHQGSVRLDEAERDKVVAISVECEWSYAQTIRVLVREALAQREAALKR